MWEWVVGIEFIDWVCYVNVENMRLNMIDYELVEIDWVSNLFGKFMVMVYIIDLIVFCDDFVIKNWVGGDY